MKQTLQFLDVIDLQRKKSKITSQISGLPSFSSQHNNNTSHRKQQSSTSKHPSLLPLATRRTVGQWTTNKLSPTFIDNNFKTKHIPSKQKSTNDRKNEKRFRFFKALNFDDNQFQQYPQWLRQRQDFTTFMYKNYEKKLLTIPLICSKNGQQRASDEKYLVSLYLQQLEIFRQVPQVIMECILKEIQTRSYKQGEIVHDEIQKVKFMGIVFVGCVEYVGRGKVVRKERNQVIMRDAFYRDQHPTITAREQTVILCIHKSIYTHLQSVLKRDLLSKNRGDIRDLMRSDFFIELHLKQKRAHQFFQHLTAQFYFKNSVICSAGEEARKFYIVFKGEVEQRNHIYIRQHNKWPLPNKRWQVRAVYNSYQNQNTLLPYSFFADQQIINNHHFKSSYQTKTFTYLYSIPSSQFISFLTPQDLKRLKKYRNQHFSINYSQFENQVRTKLKSQMENKSIIRKAISTSFSQKSNLTERKNEMLSKIEHSMIQNTKQSPPKHQQIDKQQRSPSFFK